MIVQEPNIGVHFVTLSLSYKMQPDNLRGLQSSKFLMFCATSSSIYRDVHIFLSIKIFRNGSNGLSAGSTDALVSSAPNKEFETPWESKMRIREKPNKSVTSVWDWPHASLEIHKDMKGLAAPLFVHQSETWYETFLSRFLWKDSNIVRKYLCAQISY